MYHIADLFGNIGQPMAQIRDDPSHAADGFSDWWKAWPTHDRKAEKRRCLDFWIGHGLARHASHVTAYTAHMLETPMYAKDGRAFLPAPLVFLRKEGWAEWSAPINRAIHVATNAVQVSAEHKANAKPMPAELRAKLDAMRRPK